MAEVSSEVVLEPGQVSRQADEVIAAEPKPDIAVIEVACSGRRQKADVVALLRSVPGEWDPIAVVRRIMADMRGALAADPARGPEIARCLYRLAMGGDLPEEQFGHEAYVLEDCFDLASSGIGTPAEAIHRLDEYLERHAWRHEV